MEGAEIRGKNVLGFLDNKKEHTIIIGAHYDHLGMGGKTSLHDREVAIHNGADDNADDAERGADDQRVSGAGLDRLPDLLGPHPGLLAHPADGDAGERCPECREAR